MTIVTRAAGREDVEVLARFWFEHMNERPGMERWRAVAHCPWYDEAPNHGWIAVDDGRIVGAMALVHSTRHIQGRAEKLCNIGSLYVLKPYRGRGLAKTIARESTSDPSITYFGIDAAPQTRAVLEPDAVGFNILDDRRYFWRARTARHDDSLWMRGGDAVDLAAIHDGDRPMFERHVALGMYPLLLRREGRECRVLLWIRNKHDDTMYHEALYISDPCLFAECAQAAAARLIGNADAVLAADSRFFPRPPPGAEVEKLRQPRHFKSSRLSPEYIDLLYSEVPLLGLKLS